MFPNYLKYNQQALETAKGTASLPIHDFLPIDSDKAGIDDMVLQATQFVVDRVTETTPNQN